MITSNLFGSIVPPTDNQRNSGGQYRNVSDEQWAQMLSLWSAYQSTGLTTKSINCWFPWSYFHNGPWDSYSGTKRSDYHILISAGVFTTANEYVSKPHENEIPGRTVVLTQHGIDDPNYYPGNPNGFMDFLRDALGAGKEALDWLLDQLYDEKIAQGQTEYGKTDYGLKKDGSLGMPDDDWGKGVGYDYELLYLLV